jgi:hypothetical protein
MSQDTIQVRYIGLKARCADSFPGGILTWHGPGDVQEVPAAAMPKIMQHPTVWEVVPRKTLGLADAAEPAKTETEAAVVDPWLSKTPAELHAYAAERGIRLDKRLKDADKIRAAIDAATAA